MSTLRYLHLEDNPLDAELAAATLQAEGFSVDPVRVDSEAAFRWALDAGPCDFVLSDYSLPSWGGMEALRLARCARPEWPFIFLSGTMGEETAIEALKLGA